ncbi:MAG: DUF2141 domain-containing protein [Bacteroidales bacterium]|nr:DUF2141 domain-containing protein [Bacteroidales bacterium]
MNLIMSVLLLFCGFSTVPVPDHTLSIEVVNFKNTNGQLILLLYNTVDGFKDESLTEFYRKQIVDIDSKDGVLVSFENLPSGQYAVKLIHDENADGKMNRLFLKPKEGVGVSNFETISLTNRPNFQKAAFEVNGDRILKISLIYL